MQPTDPSLARLRRQWNSERAAFITLIVVLFSALVMQWRSPKPCLLRVGGKKVGYVANPRIARQAKEETEHWLRTHYGREAQFKSEILWFPAPAPQNAPLLSLADAVKKLKRLAEPQVPAVAIQVNNRTLIVVKNLSMAEDVMHKYMRRFIDPGLAPLKPPATLERVERVPVTAVPAGQVFTDVDKAVQAIVDAGTPRRLYTVKEGDTAYEIAAAHGLTLEKLAALNPNVDLARLHIKQKLCLAEATTPLTVVIVYERRIKEPIDYPVRTIQQAGLPPGTRKVQQKGQPGQREVTYHVVTHNGIQVERKRSGEARLLKRPTPEIVLVSKK